MDYIHSFVDGLVGILCWGVLLTLILTPVKPGGLSPEPRSPPTLSVSLIMSSHSINSHTSHTTPTSHPNASFATSHTDATQHSESDQACHPHKHEMDTHNQTQMDLMGPAPSGDDLGHFSFAPTTRTTVVTTTTTTTTSFPPLTIKPPRAVKDLDTRQYPLAASPTPASLRKLQFKIGGRSIAFHEPEDAVTASTEVSENPQTPFLCPSFSRKSC